MELYGSLYNISGSVTASAFSGSFVGDGSGLVGIQASGVTGLNLSQIANADATASISSSGFTVNKDTQIQGNLAVTGAIIANEYIVSSSVTYMTTSFASGSSAFGNDVIDIHTFSGSVNIRGSISLNGEAIGTGKLDETTFQSYTSSNDSRVSALETSSGSLNSFTSSINTTIKSKLNADNVISGSVQVVLTGTTGYSTFSSSISSSVGALSSSVATTTNNLDNRVSSLETESGSIRTDFNSYTSSNDSTNSGQNNRLTSIETATSSLNLFTSSINTTIKSKLNNDGVVSGSVQVNITGTTGYSTFSSSVSTSINDLSSSVSSSIGGLSSSVTTTTSGLTSDITNLSSSVSTSIGSLSSSIGSLSSSVATTTSGLNSSIGSLSSSVATTTSGITATITNLSSSVATTTSELSSSIGSLSSSVATTDLNQNTRLNNLETSSGSLNSFTSSINTTIKSKLDSEGIISGSIQVNITGTTGYSAFSSSISSSVSASAAILSSSIGSLSSSVATTTSGLSTTITNLSSSVATTTSGITSTVTSLSSSVATTTSGLSTTITNLSSSVATTTSGITATVTSLSSSVATTTSGLSSSIGSLSSSVATTTSGLSTTIGSLSSSIATTNLNQDNRLNSIEGKTGSYATTGSNVFQGSQTITGSLYVSQNLVVQGSSSIVYVTSSQLRIDDNIITVNTSTPGARFGGLEVYDSGSVVQATGSILWDSVNNRWIYQQSSEAAYGGGVLLSGPRSSGSLGSELTLTNNRVAKSAGGDHLNDSNITDNGTTVSINSNTEVTGSVIVTGTISSTNITAIETATSSLNSFTSSINTTIKNKMNTDGVISGSAQVVAALPTGTVSGSSQVLSGTGIWSGSAQLPSGVVSGSSQVLSGTGIWSGSAQLPSGVVSGSSQVSFGGITGTPSGLVSGSSQIAFGSITGVPSGLVSGSSQVLAGTTIHSGAFFNGITVVSGSGQISYGGITGVPSGLVSGSSQITFGSVSGIPSGLVSGSSQISFGSISSVPSGLVSGSSQITLSSTTGFGSYLNQAVLTSSTPTFAGVIASNFYDGTGTYNINLGSGGSEGRGLVAGYSGGSYGGIGYNVRHTTTGASWIAPSTDTSTYLLFNSGGFTFYGAGSGTAGRTLSYSTLATLNSSGTFNASNITSGGNQVLHAGNYNSYSPTLTGTGASGTWGISISGNAATATTATTAGALSSMNISQFTNNSAYIKVNDQTYFGINNTSSSSGNGISLYGSYSGGEMNYGIMFAGTPTFGTHGSVSGDWATYFMMNNDSTRGWIFRKNGTANVASISAGGNASFTGTITASNFSGSHSGTSSGTNTGDQTNISGNAATATFSTSTSRLYSTDSAYNYSSANPYYGYLTYDGSRWLFQVSPASPAAVRVSYADSAGSASTATTAGNITAYTINQSVGTGNSPTFANTYVSGVYLRNAAGQGWLSGGYGTYETASTTGAIYSIGGSYYPTSTSFNNMHGVGYTHTNSGLLPTGPGTNGWGFYVLTNGTPNVWLGAEGVSWFAYSVLPKTNAGASLGSASYAWANIYTNDLHLSNMGKSEGNEIDGTKGTWTIQEGAENLYIINNNNGKKYKIDLTEIV